jgi:hypothetical protein
MHHNYVHEINNTQYVTGDYSSCYTFSMKEKRNLWTNLFLLTVGLEVLLGYAIGFAFLVNLPLALETGFGIGYQPDFAVLGIIIGLALVFIASMSVLSIKWTLQGDVKGVTVGIAVGLYVFLFGILAYLLLGQTDALIFDGLRGALTASFGFLTYRQFTKVV